MPRAASDRATVVYQARNLLNGHRYIGFTSQGMRERESRHRKAAEVPGKGFKFHQAIREFGQENFVFGVLAEFEDEDLGKLYEYEMIAKHQPEYNLANGGVGGTMPEVTRQRISASNKGRVGPMKGKKFTEEHKARLRASLTDLPHMKARGKPFTEERRRKLSEAAKKRAVVSWNLGGGPNKKAVLCATDGQVFESVRAASKFYDIHESAVRHVLKGRRESIRGFVFRYIEDTPK